MIDLVARRIIFPHILLILKIQDNFYHVCEITNAAYYHFYALYKPPKYKVESKVIILWELIPN